MVVKRSSTETDKDGMVLSTLTRYGTVVGWRMEMKDDFDLKIRSRNSPQYLYKLKRIQKRLVTMKLMRPRMNSRIQDVSSYPNTVKPLAKTIIDWTFRLFLWKESFEFAKSDGLQ